MPVRFLCTECNKEYFGKPSDIGRTKFCNKDCQRANRTKSLPKRYWVKVDRRGPDECWLWLGSSKGKKNGNYGHIGLGGEHGKIGLAHRVGYELEYGAISDNMNVLHTCDNPLCQNPKHLFLGTQLDNIADREAKGRGVIPDNRGRSKKLTRIQVLEIFDLKGKESQSTTARRYSIRQQHVDGIQNKRMWVWLTNELNI